MRDKIKRNKSFPRIWGLWILMGLLIICGNGNKMIVRAAEERFVIAAELLSSNEATYDIRLTIENKGADWEGNVRLVPKEEYQSPSAYDTAISLPEGSTKQFVVKVPKDSPEIDDGTVHVSVLDKKSKKLAEKEFRYLLRAQEDVLSMGILSDDYDTLTYLDMGGDELYFYSDHYPIKLLELNQDNLSDTLDSLEFLVIDNYNTSVLTDEELKAIELWNYDGGILLVGTGEYAEETLGGFEDSYLEIEYDMVYEPGETSQYSIGYYMDFYKLHLAGLWDLGNGYYDQYLTAARTCSMGDGAIGVLPYSLTELALVDSSFYQEETQEGFVLNILEEVSSEASSRYTNSGYHSNYSSYSNIKDMLGIIGNCNSSLHFGILKVIVVLYVIFVGPILYIILRVAKKRELYWIMVPVTALAGIVLVFFAGRGFEVVDTRVYSVTAKNLTDKGEYKTYLYCYDADHREWDLKLGKNYEYVGALMNDNYNYNTDEEDYYYHIQKEGDSFFFGIKPSTSFEDSFYYAGGRAEDEGGGTIVCDDLGYYWGGLGGSITNLTNKDFVYYVVIVNDAMYIYEDLKAGQTSNLGEALPAHSSTQGNGIWSGYTYDFLRDAYREKDMEKASAIAAMGVGIWSVYPQMRDNEIAVIGLTEDWNKTVDDNCKEMSYGCLYTIQ